MQESRALPLGREDPLEKGMATHSQYSCLGNPMDRGAWQAIVHRGHKESDMLLLLSRFSRVRLCATPQTVAHQALPSLGFSRQEHWSGLPFPSPMHESEREVAQSCLTLSDPMDFSQQAPPSMGFSRQSTGVGCHCLLPKGFEGP